MARTRVRVRIDHLAIRRVVNEPGGEVDLAVRRMAGKVRDRAKQNLTRDGSVDTGRLRNSVVSQRLPSGRNSVVYEVGTDVFYGIFLERGTRDHGPRRARVLRFKPKGSSSFVFARRVRGIRATRWLSRALRSLTINDVVR
jgi:hypothetical protein